jgi:hypothetical protein
VFKGHCGLSLFMWYMGVMVYMDCALINLIHFLVHPQQLPVHAGQFYVPHDPLEISMYLSLYIWNMGVRVYMDSTLNNFMHF